jgi:hypothetical protein
MAVASFAAIGFAARIAAGDKNRQGPAVSRDGRSSRSGLSEKSSVSTFYAQKTPPTRQRRTRKTLIRQMTKLSSCYPANFSSYLRENLAAQD